MAKKKNQPARPKETSLEQADKFLITAYQQLEDYESEKDLDLLSRLHAVHDQLLLSMAPAGSGQRIYQADFQAGDPRSSIADTYCHYMAPQKMDGCTLCLLYSLAALALVEDMAAKGRLRELQQMVDLLELCFLGMMRQHKALQRVSLRYVFSNPYLSKDSMCVLWLALVIHAPLPLFTRIIEDVPNEFTDDFIEDDDSDTASGGDEADDKTFSLDPGAFNHTDWNASPFPTGDTALRDAIVRLPPETRDFSIRFLLGYIEDDASQDAERYFAKELQNLHYEIRQDTTLFQQYQLMFKQIRANGPSAFGDVVGPMLVTPRLCLVLLRKCRTMVRLQLAQLLSEDELGEMRDNALDRLGDYYRRIINFLQDNLLFREGNTLGGNEESPIVAAYWSRKDAGSRLPRQVETPEPLHNAHTALPLFREIDERVDKACTRRMRRGIEEFLGTLTNRDTLQIAAGLWALGQRDTLWLDTRLANRFANAILACSPYRQGCANRRSPAEADRGKDAFLERVQPLLDAIYHPNEPYASTGAAAALSFNDLLRHVDYQISHFDEQLPESLMVSSFWANMSDILPQSDLILGGMLISVVLDMGAGYSFVRNRNTRAYYNFEAIRKVMGSRAAEQDGKE